MAALAVEAQTFDNTSLSGKYYFVELLVDSPAGQPLVARNLGGSITFDGKGAYTFAGKLGVGSAAATAVSGQGTYSVVGSGSVALTNPIRTSLQVRGWLGCAGNGASSVPGACEYLMVGSSTETTQPANDLFIAIRAPLGTASSVLLNGAYTGAAVRFTDAAAATALVSLTANGSGQFTQATVIGHATDQANNNVSQSASGASYTVNADGAGSASFGAAASLFSGARDVFVSADGGLVLGYSSAAGPRDVFLAVRNFSSATAAVPGNLEGAYRIAELTVEGDASAKTAFDGAAFSGAAGTLYPLGNGRALISERIQVGTRTDALPVPASSAPEPAVLDYSGLNLYSVAGDAAGALAPSLSQDLKNMALGPAMNTGGGVRAAVLVGAQVGVVGKVTYEHGVFFAARAPTSTGSGVFLDPTGVVNGASFAPTPYPVCPGAIVALFGTSFASDKFDAGSLPLPAVLGGLSVSVGGVPAQAPLFFVSPGQANVQIPYRLQGSSVTLQLRTSAGLSGEFTVPLAPTCPGIFYWNDGQSPYRGVVLHADYSLVTTAKPARPGETVLIYLTGLGELSPAVMAGAGNPEAPPAGAVAPGIWVYFGGEPAINVAFAGGAPRFAGLNQINVTIPLTAPVASSVPVAIATATAFTDIVDIPISW
jgi:uncharacterized protein (TIGR03437 family)